MKVRDLINQLEKLNPDLEVVGYCEDDPAPSDTPYKVFDVVNVDHQHAIQVRDSHGRPGLTFDNESPDARLIAFINLTADF